VQEDYSTRAGVERHPPEGYFHVLHPGRSPTGSLDHERRAPYEWHDAGALLDAERGDTGCQHSCAKVNITNKLQVVHIPSSWVRESELLPKEKALCHSSVSVSKRVVLNL